MANVDEWKWKLGILLANDSEREIVSRDKRDRRDYEQISNLAKRMGLYRYTKQMLSITFHLLCADLNPCFFGKVRSMEKWLLQARFLFPTTGQIWMISAHNGRYRFGCYFFVFVVLICC